MQKVRFFKILPFVHSSDKVENRSHFFREVSETFP